MIDYMMKKIKDILINILESEYYLEMLNRQDCIVKEYLIERNKSIKSDRFKFFIAKRIKDKSFEKISPADMLYNKK